MSTNLEMYNSTHYEDMKGDTKCRKWGGFGVVRVTKGHWTPFDRAHMSSF